jgi:hypothetical protein
MIPKEWHNVSQRHGVMKIRETYPSDITREEFSVIMADSLSAAKAARPRDIDIYENLYS